MTHNWSSKVIKRMKLETISERMDALAEEICLRNPQYHDEYLESRHLSPTSLPSKRHSQVIISVSLGLRTVSVCSGSSSPESSGHSSGTRVPVCSREGLQVRRLRSGLYLSHHHMVAFLLKPPIILSAFDHPSSDSEGPWRPPATVFIWASRSPSPACHSFKFPRLPPGLQ